MIFKNRIDAGNKLAEKAKTLNLGESLVFALPRGGAIVGAAVAKQLNTKLDLVMVRKIGHPNNPEYAIAAVAEEKTIVKDEMESRLVSPDWLAVALSEAAWANKRRRKLYFGELPIASVENKTVILVDDGIATGLTMMAAIQEMKNRKAKKIIVMIPVSPVDVYWKLKGMVDDVLCLKVDDAYVGTVSAYFEDFKQVCDEEVMDALRSVNG